MSETVIFIIGALIFGITVYGAVMGGGAALSRVQTEEGQRLEPPTNE